MRFSAAAQPVWRAWAQCAVATSRRPAGWSRGAGSRDTSGRTPRACWGRCSPRALASRPGPNARSAMWRRPSGPRAVLRRVATRDQCAPGDLHWCTSPADPGGLADLRDPVASGPATHPEVARCRRSRRPVRAFRLDVLATVRLPGADEQTTRVGSAALLERASTPARPSERNLVMNEKDYGPWDD